MNNIPSEDQEQMLVVQYCDIKHYPRFRVPNETFTKSWSQKRKNKALGVSPGVPDLFVIAHGQLKAVEMKRTKGSVTSEAQKQWIERLNQVGIPAAICKGAEQAIKFIETGGLQWQEQLKAETKPRKRTKQNTGRIFIGRLVEKAELQNAPQKDLDISPSATVMSLIMSTIYSNVLAKKVVEQVSKGR